MQAYRVHSTGGGHQDGWHIYIGDELVLRETVLGLESQMQSAENWFKAFFVIFSLASIGGEHSYDKRGFWLVDLGGGPPPHKVPRERVWVNGHEIT
jgi:hypothetical protein